MYEYSLFTHLTKVFKTSHHIMYMYNLKIYLLWHVFLFIVHKNILLFSSIIFNYSEIHKSDSFSDYI